MVEILTRTQAMKKMNISHTKMNQYLKDPEFPAVKDGVWYIFGERLEDYLMKLKTKGANSEELPQLKLVK